MVLLHPWAFMARDRMKLTFNFMYAFYVFCMYVFFIYLNMLHYCEIILHALKVLVTEHLF